ncbi:hypothetical protein DAEQUDRAFT_761831 [Daedalea quercina L-15889]|uniref:Nucleolar protein 12 n=1 Tax=Daedalea quercina L-15889 TaxID=1314783 RepID=A0A165TSG7_9APHY|nr:hypothetical protein DAEQUDRAFT_761831 [Daedalea quercina L-15889]
MASLSTFLLGSAEEKHVSVDKGLDAIFQSAPGPSTSSSSTSRTARPVVDASTDLARGDKKRKLAGSGGQDSKERKKSRREKDNSSKKDAKVDERSKAVNRETPRVKPRAARVDSEGDEDESSEVEYSTLMGKKATHGDARNEENDRDSSTSEDEGDPSTLVHESLLKDSQRHNGDGRSKRKYAPEDESSERRNARTIFVGNVPIEVAQSRPLQKQFKRHITALVLTAKIESVRFRSVAFAAPTAKLPSADDETGKGKGKGKDTVSEEKDGRQHDRNRAASWRAKKDEDEEPDKKQFLTPKEKKRIAFIKHELHSGVDALNAYVVFAHPIPETAARSKNVPPPAPTMDPYEAARLAAERCDGTVFMGRTIRVDRAGKFTGDAQASGAPAGDPKTTIFVGNLDFASKEEDLRAFFEALVVAERGSPGESQGEGSDEDEESAEEDEALENEVPVKKLLTWVKRVRIVRDKDTQLGKGFAYVQFVDRQCVDEILALEESQLKFAKRKLRVQRCKTVPGAPKIVPKFAKPPPTVKPSAARRPSTPRGAAPKGNPALGEKISHLPKEERKKVKASDPDRVARRMAKKQAKMLAEKGVKSKPRVERDRERKRPGEKKAVAKQAEKKGRVRSGNALAKMNTKK